MVFAIHRHELAMGVHVSPHPEPPSLLPPISNPLGCPKALALSALLQGSNLHWSSILHMIIYMFQCYSLKSSHPCLLLLSTKVSSLHLCLLCCSACRIKGTIFLNSMYVSIYSICISLSDLLHFV